ncbi:alpha/beta-hydrolase [Gymnopus androsaceus JB14]|uniref:Dipeptidyl-peptidase V n=1 Tax=Gymnopus androsaceus JB14 TaxID=1447944 RepID=A0A6A4HPQ9_9AGAR|nr:alpha/beta-hydrolase [Gymnopus androsaceus JB14]
MQEWDMRFDHTNGGYVVAALRSSAVTGELPEIWLIRTPTGKDGVPVDSITKEGIRLSDHHSSFTPDKAPTSRGFQWTSVDGETVHGIISHPRGVKEEDLSALPAVVLVHAGPYYGVEHFELQWGFLAWRAFLAYHGYVVLAPNFRGSAGGGHKFAQVKGTMGILDWDDTQTMILEALKLGFVNAKNIAIAGYSMGGFLTAWGCTRPANNEYSFKAGVCGAGLTSWGSLVESSDCPDLGTLFGVGAPWIPGEPNYVRSSPIKDACNVQCPMLFIHGKEDATGSVDPSHWNGTGY